MKSHPLGKFALKLSAKAPHKSRLSPLVFMTDPKRVADPAAQIAFLPKGSAVIYRHFSEPQRHITAKLLREFTRLQNLQLLIGGGDIELARAVKADGVHFRRDTHLYGPRAYRAAHPDKIITMAGLKTGAYKSALSCLDGLFISSVFPSQSPSAGPPIGAAALSQACRDYSVPVFALGGVTPKTAPQLLSSGVYGIAAINGFTC